MNAHKIFISINRLDLLSYYLLSTSLFFSLLGKPTRNYSMVSFATTLTIIASFIQVIFYAKKFQVKKIRSFIPLFCLLMFSILSFVIGATQGYTDIVRLICFLQIPLFISTTVYEDCKHTNKYLYFIIALVPLIYLFTLFSDHAYEYNTIYGYRIISDLTLGYNNPNETAMYLYFTLIILYSAKRNTSSRIISYFFTIEILFTIYLVFLTKCRSIIILLALTIISWIFRRRMDIYKWCIPIIHLFPFISPIFAIFFQSYLTEYRILGDSIDTGRITYYLEAFTNQSFSRILLGNFSYGFTNFHNAVMSIFVTIGIFGAISYYLVLYNMATEIYRNPIFHISIPYIGILAIVLHSSVEGGVFTAGSIFAAFYVMIYRLAIFDSIYNN